MANELKAPKYVFVTGGVLSGVGKGISASSIGRLLKARGLNVTIQKCDPYLNVDAGTLNPAEHGECFVTADGAETDLDLGHYERFLDIELSRESSLMSGRLMLQVINDERAGKYLGKTVQVIPHLTNAIQSHITDLAKNSDVHIVEIGGTVGDYESPAFIEAIRELGQKVGRDNAVFVHVVYVPYLGASGEYKTKPAQNAVRDLRSVGIMPDFIIARSEQMPPSEVVDKLSMFSGVNPNSIMLLPNAKTIYQVPISLEEQGISQVLVDRLGLECAEANLSEWTKMVRSALDNAAPELNIGVVAKYMNNQDTYMSVFEAIRSAAWSRGYQAKLHWINSEELEEDGADIDAVFGNLDGILVPGGFGNRGIEGKIKAASYALNSKKPYLGLCLGLQIAVIAAARRAGITDANSTEFDSNATQPVIATMEQQKGKENTGGSMRLGNYECVLSDGSLAQKCYQTSSITERHRHRYECNNQYVDQYESWGIKATGKSPDGTLVEMIEAVDHPFMLASQFHPEFNSRPTKPHPMFVGFIDAMTKRN